MSTLTAPVFEGDVVQCQDVVVSWEGGEYPVRVEAFYQPDPTSDWKIAGLPSEAANSNVIRWQANVPAGTLAWITIIDHSGTYRQSPQGVLVQASDDESCLTPSSNATVVTQTVFMSGDGQGSEAHLSNGLDDKALLILSICFGILAFAALATAVLLFSRLRQARRARMRGPRFSLLDEDWHGAGVGGAAAVAAAGRMGEHDRSERGQVARKTSTMSHNYEKSPPSPDTSLGEHNPFLDPPLSAGTNSTPTPFGTYTELDSRRNSSNVGSEATPTLPSGAFLRRPDMQDRNRSRADTVSSATSIQYLYDTRGQLRVANDPSQIETPVMSREVTRSSISSRYPASTQDPEDDNTPSATQTRRSSATSSASASEHANLAPNRHEGDESNAVRSSDGHSLMSSRSGRTDTTADYYASEPHSSRGWLNVSAHQPK